MEEQTDIKDHIVNHFLENKEKDINDPVLLKWLEQDNKNQQDFLQYKKIWEESVSFMDTQDFDARKGWERVNEVNRKKINKRKHLHNILYISSGVAASVLIAFMLTFMGLLKTDTDVSMSMSTAYGSRSEIKLPDGSVVRLNSGSDISYIYDGNKKIREVHFQGEGFFDITKSEEPFVVKMANGLEIKVLGTTFNLQAYAEDPTVQASLVEGHIEISHDTDKILMKAGDMTVFDTETNDLTPVNKILSHSYGWVDNKFYMDNMSLSEVCKQMERWYNVSITLQPGLGERIRYNGVIQEENVMDVMRALSELSEINHTVKGKHISITEKTK